MTNETVPPWPRVVAVVRPDATGEIVVNGATRACAAESVDALRAGVVARCAAVATTLGRPVQLAVTDDADQWVLVVRPDGVVQQLNPDGTVDPPGDLLPQESRCRVCRHLQPVSAQVCSACGVDEPHGVELPPEPTRVAGVHNEQAETRATDVAHERARPSPADVSHPQASPGDRSPAAHDVGPAVPPQTTPARTTVGPPPSPSTRPGLRITFGQGASTTVEGGAVIGRGPEPLEGRTVLRAASPGRLLSRTHLVVDLDAQGRIVVVDQHSGNGTFTHDESRTQLDPGRPYVVAPGTTLLLGDVLCTLDLA